jgi:hypothetical protein
VARKLAPWHWGCPTGVAVVDYRRLLLIIVHDGVANL